MCSHKLFQLPVQKKIKIGTTPQNEEASVELLTFHKLPYFSGVKLYYIYLTAICANSDIMRAAESLPVRTESFYQLLTDQTYDKSTHKSTTNELGTINNKQETTYNNRGIQITYIMFPTVNLTDNTPRHYKIHTILLAMCMVAMVVKAMHKNCSRIFEHDSNPQSQLFKMYE